MNQQDQEQPECICREMGAGGLGQRHTLCRAHDDEYHDECTICGADIGQSTQWLWHEANDDCRAIQEPVKPVESDGEASLDGVMYDGYHIIERNDGYGVVVIGPDGFAQLYRKQDMLPDHVDRLVRTILKNLESK